MKIDLYEDYELTDDFFNNYTLDDVLLFSYAMPGAQGYQGNIEAVVKINENEISVFSGSFMWNNPKLSEQKVSKFFYHITMNDMRELDNTDWDYLYMGAGNYLFFRKEYSSDFKEKYDKLVKKFPYILYETWREFSTYLLNKYYNNDDNEQMLQKFDEHISVLCDEFDINNLNISNEKMYIYVSVVYDDDIVATTINNPSFYYKTDNDDIFVGDKVLIDRNGKEAVGKVIDIEYFTKDEVPYPLDKTKDIIKILK